MISDVYRFEWKNERMNLLQQRFLQTISKVEENKEHREDVCSRMNRCRFEIDKDVYEIVKDIWGKAFAPFITEGLYSFLAVCWKNQMTNLIGMVIVDIALGHDKYRKVEEKWYLFSVILALAGMGNFMEAVSWERIEQAKKISCKMHGRVVPCYGWYKNVPDKDCWHDYYEYVVKPMAIAIAAEGGNGKLFEYTDDWRHVANRLEVPVHLNEEIMKFLIEDAIGYISAGDTSHYNPFWIFGSECYEEIMEDLNERNRAIHK